MCHSGSRSLGPAIVGHSESALHPWWQSRVGAHFRRLCRLGGDGRCPPGHYELDEMILGNAPGAQVELHALSGTFGYRDSLSTLSALSCLMSHLNFSHVLTCTLESSAISLISPLLQKPPLFPETVLSFTPGPGSSVP